MALKRVKGWLFREGRYPDKSVPEADLGFLHRYAAGSNALPRIPLDFEHGPTERCFDFGQVVPGSVRVEHGLPRIKLSQRRRRPIGRRYWAGWVGRATRPQHRRSRGIPLGHPTTTSLRTQ
ncbi:MAG: hypothetical protein HUU35_06905 [Armatimonadetes bacterium]|nr:hypothetical protein [Armatimonadota bacterium]